MHEVAGNIHISTICPTNRCHLSRLNLGMIKGTVKMIMLIVQA
jgi:hypothetical protein